MKNIILKILLAAVIFISFIPPMHAEELPTLPYMYFVRFEYGYDYKEYETNDTFSKDDEPSNVMMYFGSMDEKWNGIKADVYIAGYSNGDMVFMQSKLITFDKTGGYYLHLDKARGTIDDKKLFADHVDEVKFFAFEHGTLRPFHENLTLKRVD